MENMVSMYSHILLGCGFVCCLFAFFVRTINFHSIKRKNALIKIELGVSILLLADALTKILRGSAATPAGKVFFHVAYFLMFLFTLLNQIFLNAYLVTLFMGQGKFYKVPLLLNMAFIVATVGLLFVIANIFYPFYYGFDNAGLYIRGPLFLLSYVAPLLTVGLQLVFVLIYRKMITKSIFGSVVFYCCTPLVAGIAQIFIPGLSLINMSMFLAAVVLFWFALIDLNVELYNAATTEILTGLPNLYGFQSQIDRINNSGDLTLYNGYYFDMVRMNQLNNKYGKKMGDEIIRKYGQGLSAELEKDEIIGRLGGNFFVALVKKTNTDKFLNMLADFPIDIEINGTIKTIHISSVAGCYEVKSKHLPTGKILGCTSAAVAYAKKVRKPYVFMDDDLEEELERIRKLEENTRKALEKREFEPFYQPKVDSHTQKLIGAEALVRWKSGSKYISPAEFVPVMENNGSICDLDFCMLTSVCLDLRNWLDKGIDPVTVSVNFSRRNLGNHEFAKNVSDLVESYNVPKELIQVEITETIDEHPMSALVDVVEELRKLGISTAIDDFGTGSSSIKLLKEVKFDVMKIDKSFVDYKDETEKKILMDIIHMADNIGLNVVAEGVEEAAKVSELANMGCTEIQGFFYDKPLEKAEFEKRLLDKSYS